MWVCLVRVKVPVPTVIETGLGTSCGLAALAAADVGDAETATTRPEMATKRETTRLVLRRRVDIADLSAPSSGNVHRYPEAVHFVRKPVCTHAPDEDKTSRRTAGRHHGWSP